MTREEIYQLIATKIKEGTNGEIWTEGVANIERLDGMVKFTGYYLTEHNEKKGLESNFGFFDGQAIHKLYTVTTSEEGNRWNKLKFTLYPTEKHTVEYVWDQAYQDEIDDLNKK